MMEDTRLTKNVSKEYILKNFESKSPSIIYHPQNMYIWPSGQVLTHVCRLGIGSVAHAAGQSSWISSQRAAAALCNNLRHWHMNHKSLSYMFIFYEATLFHHGVAAPNWEGSSLRGNMQTTNNWSFFQPYRGRVLISTSNPCMSLSQTCTCMHALKVWMSVPAYITYYVCMWHIDCMHLSHGYMGLLANGLLTAPPW